MMRQTNDCSPVRVMQHKVMYFLYLTQKILVKINLPGQKSHPSSNFLGVFLSEKKRGYNRIKALGLCQGWTRPRALIHNPQPDLTASYGGIEGQDHRSKVKVKYQSFSLLSEKLI